jgi:uncharacterized protein
MQNVLITGGSGMIGTRLSQQLLEKGYSVSIFSREKKMLEGIKVYLWNPEKKEVDVRAIEQADFIVHLAGENIGAKRWTEKRKKEIYDSRIRTAALIFDKARILKKKPAAFISASAVGYYGAVTSEHIFTETDPPLYDFVSTVCVKWEEMADNFNSIGMRVAKIRTSPVLSQKGGVLDQLKKPVEFGLAAAVGTGRQYFPWIHIDDICGIYLKAIEDVNMKGVYNAASPGHITNEELMRTLAQIMDKPFWFPKVPSFLMKLVYGEMGEVALKGSRISSEKIQAAGYQFLFPKLKPALEDVLNSEKQKELREEKQDAEVNAS